MGDIRLSILAMDNSLKVLTTHYDIKTSNQLRIFSDQVNTFEKRWTQLIDNLEQCSARFKKSPIIFATSVQENIRPESNTVEKTITTIVEETTIKKRKIDNDNTLKHNFDLSARKFIDWMDSIERILDNKQSNNLKTTDRQEIIQEIKSKYISYDEQFKELILTGHIVTKQLREGK
jgi:hypothetical protein